MAIQLLIKCKTKITKLNSIIRYSLKTWMRPLSLHAEKIAEEVECVLEMICVYNWGFLWDFFVKKAFLICYVLKF